MIFLRPGITPKCVTTTTLVDPLKTTRVLNSHASPSQARSHLQLCCPAAEITRGELQD